MMGILHYLYPAVFWFTIKYVAPVSITVGALWVLTYWVPMGHHPAPPAESEPEPEPFWTTRVIHDYHDDGRREF